MKRVFLLVLLLLLPAAHGWDLWVEAEDGALLSPMQAFSDATASGGQYVAATSGSAGEASYTFSVPSAGTYYVWARYFAPDGDHNSVFVSLDGGSQDQWNLNTGSWQWGRVPASSYSLSAGEHVLVFHQREYDSRIDKILLTDNASLVPSGLGGSSNPVPGDVNGDGVVDLLDLVIISNNYGVAAFDARADRNTDGSVNLFDLVLVARYWNGAASVDSTPPSLTNLQPTGTVASTSPTLSVTTDEAATCRYSASDVAYDSMTPFSSTGATSHAHTTAGLADGAHTYYVRCQDSAGNTGSAQIAFTVSTGSGGPPTLDSLLFSEDFEGGTLNAWDDSYSGANLAVQSGVLAHGGNNYLRVSYPGGSDGSSLSKLLDQGYHEVVGRYWLRVPESFVGGTKLMLFRATPEADPWSGFGRAGECPNGTDFAFANVIVDDMFGEGLLFYNYWPSMWTEPDGVTCWGRHGDGSETMYAPLTFSADEWHLLEFYARTNTIGNADGELRVWLDGELKGEWPGIDYRTVEDLLWTVFTIELSAQPEPSARELYIDDIEVWGSRWSAGSAPPPAADEPVFSSSTDSEWFYDGFEEYSSTAHLLTWEAVRPSRWTYKGSPVLATSGAYAGTNAVRFTYIAGGQGDNAVETTSSGVSSDADVVVLSWWMRTQPGYEWWTSDPGCAGCQGHKIMVGNIGGVAQGNRMLLQYASDDIIPGALQSCYPSASGIASATWSIANVLYKQNLNYTSWDIYTDENDGNWHRYTVRFQKSTSRPTVDEGDGRLEMWVDGVKVMEYIGDDPARCEYGMVNIPTVTLYGDMHFPSVNGGAASEQWLEFDEVRLFTPAAQAVVENDILLPLASDFTDQGVIVASGPDGSWDNKIGGALMPALARLGNTLLLYYVGGEDERQAIDSSTYPGDTDPARRRLGAATSLDGVSWSKSASNPLISHEVGPSGTLESGVFSAAPLVEGSTLHMWYAGMEEGSTGSGPSGSVDAEGPYRASSDGISFGAATDEVIDAQDSYFDNYGDELSPIGAYFDGSDYWVFYISKGLQGEWFMSYARGPTPTDLSTQTGRVSSLAWRGGGSPQVLNASALVMPRLPALFTDSLELWTAGPSDPTAWSAARTLTFSGRSFSGATLYLDRDLGLWLLPYIESNDADIRLMTAPVRTA